MSAEVRLLEHLCEVAHDAYEAAAPGAGLETNPASRKPWAEVPEANKEPMRAAIAAVLESVRAHDAVGACYACNTTKT